MLLQHGWGSARCRWVIAVEYVGVEVESTWPGGGAGDLVDGDSTERLVVVNVRQHAAERSGEVQVSRQSVIEAHSQHASAKVLDVHNPR